MSQSKLVENIWTFKVKPDKVNDFLKMNQTDFPLFFGIGSQDYHGTAVCQSINQANVYLTRDLWTSKQAFGKFVSENQEKYNRMIKKHEELCESSIHIGWFPNLRKSNFRVVRP